MPFTELELERLIEAKRRDAEQQSVFSKQECAAERQRVEQRLAALVTAKLKSGFPLTPRRASAPDLHRTMPRVPSKGSIKLAAGGGPSAEAPLAAEAASPAGRPLAALAGGARAKPPASSEPAPATAAAPAPTPPPPPPLAEERRRPPALELQPSVIEADSDCSIDTPPKVTLLARRAAATRESRLADVALSADSPPGSPGVDRVEAFVLDSDDSEF